MEFSKLGFIIHLSIFSIISGMNGITFKFYDLFILQQWCLLWSVPAHPVIDVKYDDVWSHISLNTNNIRMWYFASRKKNLWMLWYFLFESFRCNGWKVNFEKPQKVSQLIPSDGTTYQSVDSLIYLSHKWEVFNSVKKEVFPNHYFIQNNTFQLLISPQHWYSKQILSKILRAFNTHPYAILFFLRGLS